MNTRDILLANLNIMDIKIHNFHYNVVGPLFLNTHLQLEDEYNFIHDTIDTVAERIKAIGEHPQASMKEYLDCATIREAESRDYKPNEIFQALIADYKILVDNINLLRPQADPVTQSMLDDIQEELEKKLWFFKSTIK